MAATVAKVLNKLEQMREHGFWPNGMRYLWTDAFGVALLVSLHHGLRQNKFLDEAQRVVADVERPLGRRGAVFELARLRIATASTFTIWRCGFMRYHASAR